MHIFSLQSVWEIRSFTFHDMIMVTHRTVLWHSPSAFHVKQLISLQTEFDTLPSVEDIILDSLFVCMYRICNLFLSTLKV